MRAFNISHLILLIIVSYVSAGGSERDIERVRSPYVDSRDLGQMMESGYSQGMMHKGPSSGHYSHRNYGQHSKPCLLCQNMGGGVSSSYSGGFPSGSSSYSSSNAYSSYSGMGGNPVYSSQPLASSSRHEIKKEQEFVNGQQVYDFHHEQKYRDGKLVDEKRYENAPDDFDDSLPGLPAFAASQGFGSSTNAFSSSQAHYNSLPRTQTHPNQYGEYGIDHSFHGNGDFNKQFESEVERLQEEMRRKTLSLSNQPVVSGPTYGGSHKTEFRTQTKYVNGKPVYVLNEERKYKDGKLVHNVTEEKGPDDLGTSHVVGGTSPFLSSPTGHVYSSNQQEVRSKSQSSHYPPSYPSSYPGYYSSELSSTDETREKHYRPSSYGYSSEVASSFAHPSGRDSSIDTLNTGPIVSSMPSTSYHRPSSVYSTEVREERKETQSQTSNVYRPNNYQTDHNRYDSTRNYHQQPSTPDSYGPYHHRPESNSHYTTPRPYTVTSTTTTTPRQSNSGYDYSYYDRKNQSPTYNQVRNSYEKQDSSSSIYSHNRPSETTQRPYYGYNNPRSPYDEVPDDTYDRSSPSSPSGPYGRGPNAPATERPHRESYSGYENSERIKSVSQSSHYDSRTQPSRSRPYESTNPDNDKYAPTSYGTRDNTLDRHITYESNTDDVHALDEVETPRRRQPSYAQRNREEEINTNQRIPYQDRRSPDTSSYDSETHRTSTVEERAHSYDSNRRNHYRPSHPDDVDFNGSPTHTARPRGPVTGPDSNENDDDDDKKEQERYDISPYDDASHGSKADEDELTRRVQHKNQPGYNPNTAHTSSYNSSKFYEESRRRTVNPVTTYDNTPNTGSQHTYTDSSNLNQLTTTLPSKWVEIRTTSNYVNGRLVSETKYHKYFENGIMTHENTTHRTRNELITDGVNVGNLDLSPSELAQYGSVYSTRSHSQKHEMHQIKRFRNGKQIYELNHDKRFQDGILIHEDKDEKDEDDFINFDREDDSNYHLTQTHHLNHQLVGGEDGIHRTVSVSSPQSYTRRHELRQEEEYINGKKIYDLHHEKKFQDGMLVHENKTELRPEELGHQPTIHRDSLKELLSGNTQNIIGQTALLEQKRVADSVLSTSCLTCGQGHQGSTFTGGSTMLGTLGLGGHGVGHSAGSTFRQDLNVEEHYANGQLVKGRKEDKKWVDGQLVDAKEQHYYDGPSRVNQTVSSAAHSSSSFSQGGSSVGQGCSYNPCLNKGRCKMSVNGPVCICPFGFKGKNCEEVYCPNRYCRYGGSCYIENGKQECRCREGYSGYRCSTRYQNLKLGVTG